jgi:CRP-like cAMP-binding protein
MELYSQADPAKDVYLIEQGLVELTWLNEQGHELVVGLRHPGWLLGASSVILEEPHSATATTVIPCRLRRLRAEEFRRLARTNVELSWSLNQMLSREVQAQAVYACGLGLLSARNRLEQFLWDLSVSTGGGQERKPVRLQLPLKKSEVARLIAITPQYLSELLKQLENAGILRREKGWLIVLDPERLWHQSDFSREWFCALSLVVQG